MAVLFFVRWTGEEPSLYPSQDPSPSSRIPLQSAPNTTKPEIILPLAFHPEDQESDALPARSLLYWEKRQQTAWRWCWRRRGGASRSRTAPSQTAPFSSRTESSPGWRSSRPDWLWSWERHERKGLPRSLRYGGRRGGARTSRRGWWMQQSSLKPSPPRFSPSPLAA